MYTLPAEELHLRSTQPKHRKQRPACPTGPRERDGFVKPVYGCHWKRCQSCLQLSSIFQEDTFFLIPDFPYRKWKAHWLSLKKARSMGYFLDRFDEEVEAIATSSYCEAVRG